MKLTRPDEPDFLRENSVQWGKEYAEKRAQEPSARFSWRGSRELIANALDPMCGDYCCFCDGFPLGAESRKTIEHFRPTSKFPHLAYSWPNLFFACDVCQQAKLDKFDEKLLKPDDPDYEFETYFILDYKTGELLVNPAATEFARQRAQMTIDIFGLNQRARLKSRIRMRRLYQMQPLEERFINEFPYRFFVE